MSERGCGYRSQREIAPGVRAARVGSSSSSRGPRERREVLIRCFLSFFLSFFVAQSESEYMKLCVLSLARRFPWEGGNWSTYSSRRSVFFFLFFLKTYSNSLAAPGRPLLTFIHLSGAFKEAKDQDAKQRMKEKEIAHCISI